MHENWCIRRGVRPTEAAHEQDPHFSATQKLGMLPSRMTCLCNILQLYIYFKKTKLLEEHTHTHYHSLKIYVFVWERESEAVSTPQSCRDDEKATQPPQLLPWKTFLSVFQFTVNRIFSSLSLFRCSCLSYPDSTAPSFIHLQSTLSELACLYK